MSVQEINTTSRERIDPSGLVNDFTVFRLLVFDLARRLTAVKAQNKELRKALREAQAVNCSAPIPEGQETAPKPEIKIVPMMPDTTPEGILVISGSRVLQIHIKAILDTLDFKLHGIASDFVLGTKAIRVKNPKVVIADYHDDSADDFKQLCELKAAVGTFKLIVCASDVTESLSYCLVKAGADEIIRKPIHVNSLIGAVQRSITNPKPKVMKASG